MTQERKNPNEIFTAVISLDMTAHELEVARRAATDEEKDYASREFWRSRIQPLEQQFAEQYTRLWSALPGIENSVDGTVAGIARTAMRAIARACGVAVPDVSPSH